MNDKAYELGRRDYQAGADFDDNPYTLGTVLATDWRQGFIDQSRYVEGWDYDEEYQ